MAIGYDIENQAGSILLDQRAGNLYTVDKIVKSVSLEFEANIGWYVISFERGLWPNGFYAPDCDREVIESLKEGNNITIVLSGVAYRGIHSRYGATSVAYVTDSQGREVYRSPTYDPNFKPEPDTLESELEDDAI